MYKQDLALNNLQELICHKTQPTNLALVRATGLGEGKLWRGGPPTLPV